MNRRTLINALLAGLALPSALPALAAAPVVHAAGTQRDGGRLRLWLELSGPVQVNSFSLEAPPRLVVDLRGARLAASLASLPLAGTPVRDLRDGVTPQGDLRLVLDLAAPATLKVEPQSGSRLWLDVLPGVATSDVAAPLAATASRRPAHPAGKDGRDVLVVVDAGHGGKDPGALGGNGEQEKWVALSIARLLARRIDAQTGFKARLVRNDDIFIPLRQRAAVARRYNADLFLSVHADAAPRRDAAGASVFALSEHGATSTLARWMAERENDADYAGGSLPVLKGKDPVLAGVLLDMSMNATIASSLDLGHTVLGSLEPITGLHQKRVEQAGFAVLKSPDVPSILVETGFISNAGDCRRLVDTRHQQKVAEAIFAGLHDYFRQRPPQGSYLATLAQT